MAIYTKTGDTGTTSLFGGERISKSDARLCAYGDLDELTSILGMIVVKMRKVPDKEFITLIQSDLYMIMGYLAGAQVPVAPAADRVVVFEKKIDLMDLKMPKLHRFILPGGTELSSWIHIARACSRRAERSIVAAFGPDPEDVQISIVIKYVNRLSDLLFTLARWYNKGREVVT